MWGNFQKAPETEEEDKRVFGLSKKEKKKRENWENVARRGHKKRKKENVEIFKKTNREFLSVFFFSF